MDELSPKERQSQARQESHDAISKEDIYLTSRTLGILISIPLALALLKYGNHIMPATWVKPAALLVVLGSILLTRIVVLRIRQKLPPDSRWRYWL